MSILLTVMLIKRSLDFVSMFWIILKLPFPILIPGEKNQNMYYDYLNICMYKHTFLKTPKCLFWILDFTYSTSFGDHRTINLPNCSFSIFQLLHRFEAIGQRIMRSASLSETLIQNIQKFSRESNVVVFSNSYIYFASGFWLFFNNHITAEYKL